MSDDGTIDITDAVEKMRSTFVIAASDFLFAWIAAAPGFGWVLYPILKPLTEIVLKKILETLSTWIVMQAFFFNTAMRKSSQAADFVRAVVAKENLPEDVSDEEFEKAQLNEIEAFNRLVRLTS